MSPLSEPLLSRFGGGEFRHFFAVELQDAGVFMPHDLRETFEWLFFSISDEDQHRAGSRNEWRFLKADLPVVGGTTQHLWTPSRMHGRGVVEPQWGKRSMHRGSTGQSPAALCPTNVLQL